MSHPLSRGIALAVLLSTALVLPSCVQLAGQRLTIFYDASADQLFFLIHYDGVHDSGSDRHGKGVKQIPEFVNNRNVLLLDWPFHFQFERLGMREAERERHPALAKLTDALTSSVERRIIGRYRDTEGRVGAAQMVVINNARDLVARANAAISEGIVHEWSGKIEVLKEGRRTMRRILEAARKNHTWITIDGHSLFGRLPVHAREWTYLKGKVLKQLLESIHETIVDAQKDPAAGREALAVIARSAQFAAVTPLSYEDHGDYVTLRVGRRKQPSTLRATLRNKYETSLESVIAEAVPAELDKAVATSLLDPSSSVSADIRKLIKWGPPEDQVRALIGAAANEATQKAAVKRLQEWAKSWNTTQGYPDAPTPLEDAAAYLDAWKKWYREALAFPLEHKEVLPPPEEKAPSEKKEPAKGSAR